MEKISAVYKIVNIVTGDFYVGSSRNVKERWNQHKRSSTWKQKPNSKLYQDMEKYGIENFRFQILAPVEPEHLKQVEQEFIELLRPTYNAIYAKGVDAERYRKSHRKSKIKYTQSGKWKEYGQSAKGKEVLKKANKKYYSQICMFNGETLTLKVLSARFRRAGIPHATLEAKKYLITEGENAT